MDKNRKVDTSGLILLLMSAWKVIPGYGVGRPVRPADIDRLARSVGLQYGPSDLDMDSVAALFPPWKGRYQLIWAPWVRPPLQWHILLHEIAHVIRGDIDEPTTMVFTDALPPGEDLADMFSLVGLLDDAEVAQGPRYVEERVRGLAPMDNYGWQTYRVTRLAPQVALAKEAARVGWEHVNPRRERKAKTSR